MTFNAYHFTGSTLRDGRPVPAVGETLVHTGPIEWCQSGLYASRTAWDALRYAPDGTLHRVLCEDIEREDGDKLVCRRRTIVATIDATHLLRRFAADQALSVAHLWDMPDVVRDYLMTLDEDKRAASEATAWATAWHAARATAWAASEAAAWAAAAWAATAWAAEAAAAEAAWAAAREAAWEAAWAAAAWAAEDAHLTKAATDFNERVNAAFAAS